MPKMGDAPAGCFVGHLHDDPPEWAKQPSDNEADPGPDSNDSERQYDGTGRMGDALPGTSASSLPKFFGG